MVWAAVLALPMTVGGVPLAERREYVAGMEAMEVGLPEVAMRKLEWLAESGELTGEERAHLLPVLVEAQVRAGRGKAALEVIGSGEVEVPPYWKGLALAGEGRTEEAVEELGKILEGHLYYGEAMLTRASYLWELGRIEEAVKLFEEIAEEGEVEQSVRARVMLAQLELSRGELPRVHSVLAPLVGLGYPDRAEVDYLIAVAYLKGGDFQRAHGALLQIRQRVEVLGPPLEDAVPVALADAELGIGQPRAAYARLVELVERAPESPVLGGVFDRLSGTEAFDGEGLEEKLAGWAEGQSRPLAGLAMFHLGLRKARKGLEEEALEALGRFRGAYPGHALEGRALMESAKIHVRRGEKDLALGLLEEMGEVGGGKGSRYERKFLSGLARYAGGDYAGAAEDFGTAAEGAGGSEEALYAVYDAAVSAVKSGDGGGFERLFTALEPGGENVGGVGGKQAQADLLIGAGLEAAATGKDAEAIEKLEEFVKEFSGHPRVAEARLALAELYLLQFPPREQSARKHLSETAGIPEGSPWREQLDYVRMWVEKGAANPAGLIEEAQRFLKRWPESARVPDVRMQLGEAYYQTQDFPNAQTQFELLATEYPDSPYTEAALFYAGRSAMALMNRKGLERAIEIWGQVVVRGGELSLEASKQQAIAKRRLGLDAEAIKVLEGILSGTPAPEGDFLYDVLCEKGETLLTQGGEEKTAEAAAIFRKVGEDAGARKVWRDRAQFHLAKCLERLGDRGGALEACFEVISSHEEEGADAEEFVWYFRAGFEAVHLLQEEGRWVPAVNVAEKLAAANGPRSQEARELAEEIRLKHFLWDEKKVRGAAGGER